MKFLKFWLPLIIWSGVIFYASTLTSDVFPVTLLDTFSSYFGHFLLYMILGLLSIRAFDNSFPAQGFKKNILYSGSFCFLYALSDEFHQAFVPTRFCSFSDIMTDVLGVLFAFFLVIIWRRFLIY